VHLRRTLITNIAESFDVSAILNFAGTTFEGEDAEDICRTNGALPKDRRL